MFLVAEATVHQSADGKVSQWRSKSEDLPKLLKYKNDFREQKSKKSDMNHRFKFSPSYIILKLRLLSGIMMVIGGLLFVSSSCVQNEGKKLDRELPDSVWKPQYAKGFQIEYFSEYKKVIVFDPWNTNNILAQYILKSFESTIKFSKEYTLVDVPFTSMACLFAPDVAFAQQLDLVPYIKATSSIEYMHNEMLKKQVLEKKTIDVGPSDNFNVEKLLASGASVCFVSPFRENRYKKIEEAGIPVIINSCHMEEDPLARAEWLVFFAAFFKMENRAINTFNNIEKQYLDAKKQVELISHRPTVFSGKLFQDVWYVSGGKSYISRLFQDAGAHYIWHNLDFSGSEPYDLEIIMSKAINADFWVVQEYTDKNYNYQRLASENIKYTFFDAFKKKNVILCNSQLTPYYETGVLEPHLILQDLIHLFHPNLLSEHKVLYFKPLKQ